MDDEIQAILADVQEIRVRSLPGRGGRGRKRPDGREDGALAREKDRVERQLVEAGLRRG